MEQALELLVNWCNKNSAKNMNIEVLRIESRTPVILINIKGSLNKNVLYYGHLDKQPEMTGWDSNLGPYKPVLKNGKLYGRAAADDGYALFSALASVLALQQQDLAHPTIQILIEASEESGSIDLPYYIDKYADKFYSPDLVICLDSGCGNYNNLWLTSSLRGLVTVDVEVKVLKEGLHSGIAGGIVPSALQIFNKQLEKICCDKSNITNLESCNVTIPSIRQAQILHTASILEQQFHGDFPLEDGVKLLSDNVAQLLTNQTWRGSVTVIGIDGIPQLKNAGNVHNPNLTARLSVRIPATSNPEKVAKEITQKLTENIPFNAIVKCNTITTTAGWHCPIESNKLQQTLTESAELFFNEECAYMGEGGSIPFINLLEKKFPKAEFVITGVLGPHSNAHGPNEFLDIEYSKKITAAMSYLIYNYSQ